MKIKKKYFMFPENHLIPVVAKKGSVIIWTSSTIHCARLQSKPIGPRCVVYICYHINNELRKQDLLRSQKLYEENRVSNHWITRMFPKTFMHIPNYDERMLSIIKNPLEVYNILGKPELNEVQKKLCGY